MKADLPEDEWLSQRLLVLPQTKADYTCLLKPQLSKKIVRGHFYRGPVSGVAFVDFINDKCDTYLTETGALNAAGLHREEILSNLYSVTDSPTLSDIFESCDDVKRFYYSGLCEQTNQTVLLKPALCEETFDIPSPEDFLRNNIFRSKPLILRGAALNWDIMSRWSNSYLRAVVGNETVHVKLTPFGEFEGVEARSLWQNGEKNIRIPSEVLSL